MNNLIQHMTQSCVTYGGGALAALTLLLGLVFGSIQAQAVTSLVNFGNGNQTLDETTNLLWYDLDKTTNMSWNEMNTAFTTVGSNFFGYRHATEAEITKFWEDAGLGTQPQFVAGYFEDPSRSSEYNIYISLTGTTFASPTQQVQRGIFELLNNNSLKAGEIFNYAPEISVVADNLRTTFFSGFNNDAANFKSNVYGHFIVKAAPTAVPEPSALLMIGLGIMGAVGLRMRRK